MALINCPECGKQISDKAKVCIHCGFELNFEKCPECGAPLFSADTVCRNCGCPREERTEKERIINIVPDRRGFSDLLTEKTAVELINYVQFSTAKIINWKSKGLLV